MLLSLLIAPAVSATLNPEDLDEMGVSDDVAGLHVEVSHSRLMGNEDIDQDLLVHTLPDLVKQLTPAAADAKSCLNIVGIDAGLHMAATGLSINAPKGLTEDEAWAYSLVLQTSVFPQYRELRQTLATKLDALIEEGVCIDYAAVVRANIPTPPPKTRKRRR